MNARWLLPSILLLLLAARDLSAQPGAPAPRVPVRVTLEAAGALADRFVVESQPLQPIPRAIRLRHDATPEDLSLAVHALLALDSRPDRGEGRTARHRVRRRVGAGDRILPWAPRVLADLRVRGREVNGRQRGTDRSVVIYLPAR